MNILLLSDIHANFPALEACVNSFPEISFDAIYNCGDSIVYGPFPNQTLHWLKTNNVYSIRGNTDKKVVKLLKGKTFKKPKMAEKRIMYSWTADILDSSSRKYLLSLNESMNFSIGTHNIGIFHGSPEHLNEFLFPNTPQKRFKELASICPYDIIITGHSHTPYHKQIGNTHFINPGSVGRMFDSNPTASCAILSMKSNAIKVVHHRIPWPIQLTINALKKYQLPEIYQTMYIAGKKLN